MIKYQIKSRYLIYATLFFLIITSACQQKSTSFYFNNGSTKYQLKKYQDAIQDLDQAIGLDNNYLEAYYVRALCFGNLQQLDKALNDFNQVIELDSNYKEAYINRGFYVFEKKGDYQAAINDYNKFLELNKNGDNAFAYNNRGYAKYKSDDFDGAMEDILESIRLNPTNSFVYKNRALIYLEMDSISLACIDLEHARSLGFNEAYGPEVDELINKFCQTD